MNNRSTKLLALLLALLMLFPMVMMACGKGNDTTKPDSTKGTDTTSESTSEDTTEASDTTTESETTSEDETEGTTEDPKKYNNTEYDNFAAFEAEPKKLGVATKIISEITGTYFNKQLKYFVNDTYSADLTTYTEKAVTEINKPNNLIVVWDIKTEGDTVSVYLSPVEFKFETQYTQYSAQQGKDFMLSFKTNLPFIVYAKIAPKTATKSLSMSENTPFVAKQTSGKNGKIEDRIKIKYIFDNPGEYVINFFYRIETNNNREFNLQFATSVPFTITENKKYVDSPFKGYVLNIDGSMSTIAIDRFEAGFYKKFPDMYYSFSTLAQAKQPNEKTIYLRVVTKSTYDPIGHPTDEMIAYVWGRPDTIFFNTSTASALDVEDTMVHELTHIFEKGFNSTPGFFTEGLAEAVRYVYGGNKDSGWNPPNDKTGELVSYNAGGFFVYIAKNYGEYFAHKNRNNPNGVKTILVEIFRLAKDKSWTESNWVWMTGKSYAELLAEYRASNFTMPTDYSKADGNYINFVKDLRATVPEGFVFN